MLFLIYLKKCFSHSVHLELPVGSRAKHQSGQKTDSSRLECADVGILINIKFSRVDKNYSIQTHIQLKFSPWKIRRNMKLDYIPNILPQTRCPAKFSFRLKGSSNWLKVAIFVVFSRFLEYTGRKKFCLLKFIFHQDTSFRFF